MSINEKTTTNSVKFSPLPDKEPNDDDDSVQDAVYVCGIGSFHPKWLQYFVNAKAYLLFYCILGIIQGAYFTYIVGIVSTMEKRYAYDSKISGLILVADNLSPVVTSLLLGYYGGQAHRPRLMAYGMLIVCVSCLLSTLPYFIYGPALHMISAPNLVDKLQQSSNDTRFQICDANEHDGKDCHSGVSRTTLPAICMFFLANLLNGFGNTAYYSLGMAYLDDNVKKKDSPVYFSTMMGIRLFGPSLGFLLSSFCLKFYEDPTYDPGFSFNDPRWIGAWWMGFLIIGVLLFVFTIPMFLFPRKLVNIDSSEKVVKPEMPKLKDMPKALMGLIKNKIYFFHTTAHVFQIIGYAGYYIMMPRFMEAHFRKSASSASLFSGSTSIVTMLIGIILGGAIIRRWQPRPRLLTGYMVGVEMITVMSLFSLMFLSCPAQQFDAPHLNNQLVLDNACNADCGCTTEVYQQSCTVDGSYTYFTPCHAGCTDFIVGLNGTTTFTNCSCTSGNETSGWTDLVSGYCPFECNLFLPYILLLSISKMISSTSRVGSTLVIFRCVEPHVKTLALGTSSFLISIFALIPYPLIFGAIADSTCLVWEKSCGKTGNCWIYDTDKFRVYLHGGAFLFLLVGTVFDFFVFLWSGSLKDFYEDDADDPKKNGKMVMAEWKKEQDDDILFNFKMAEIKNQQ